MNYQKDRYLQKITKKYFQVYTYLHIFIFVIQLKHSMNTFLCEFDR